jgi:hypothetical protein
MLLSTNLPSIDTKTVSKATDTRLSRALYQLAPASAALSAMADAGPAVHADLLLGVSTLLDPDRVMRMLGQLQRCKH